MDFLKSKFDNLSLFALISVLILVMLHMSHDKADETLVSWLEQTITTVLGAYIGLTQAHRLPWLNKNGGNNDKTRVVDDGTPAGSSSSGVPKA